MGLSTSPSPGSCKGLVKARAGKTDLTSSGWRSSWKFPGEALQYYTPQGASSAPWVPVVDETGGGVVTSWFKTTLPLPQSPQQQQREGSTTAPPQLAYALDLNGATKGVVWVNGVNLGRYNLEAGTCSGSCAPPQHGPICYIFWKNCGLPTQRYYHVPTAILTPGENLVVLFEETSTVPESGSGPVLPSPPPLPLTLRSPQPIPRNLSLVALVAFTAHPD